MIGLFLITHSTYGESLIQCACHVLNKRPPQVAQLGLTPQDDPLDTLPLARQLLGCIDSGDGVLILTDVYGASPANLAMKLGRTLTWDPAQGCVVGDEEANRLLRRPYRAPWVHPAERVL